jgi:2,5-furandicarboxylate decarboxylase 1
MSLRALLRAIQDAGQLQTLSRQVDPHLELAALIAQLGERPVLFDQVKGSRYTVAAGLCSRRECFALGLGVPKEQLLFALADALRNPVPAPILSDHDAKKAACREVVDDEVDLFALPLLTHLPGDGGAYVTAGVAIIKDPELGRNMSFHRLMRLDRKRFAIRLVEHRGTHMALQKAGAELQIAICIGNSPAVLLAAAMSPAPGVDELAIANALTPTALVKCQTVDLEVPAEAEIVLEGRITPQTVPEGPFLDLTGTMDIVREQPVVEITAVTHRRDAIYQALLPGGLEHKLLMGMPREPTIYAEVDKVCDCVNVLLTPGGASWLHAVVQIRKHHPDDGRRAIEAAFKGHSSLKHVLVVDDDIDIYDPADREWAIATRFQADRGLVVWPDRPGSSLDPSALHVPGQKSRTAKMGLDATIPWQWPSGGMRTKEERAAFRRVHYSGTQVSHSDSPAKGGVRSTADSDGT